MPSYMDMISKAAKKVVAPYPSAPKAPALPDRPTPIPGQFYNNLTEFTAWQPWGTCPDHTKKNEKYIPIKNKVAMKPDYPAELQRLIDVGWKAATTPTGGRSASFVLGGARGKANGTGNVPQPGDPSLLRKGLGRAVANNFGHMNLFDLVAAFTFRGDSRSPDQIRVADGFYPPSMRTDEFYKGTIAEAFYKYMNRREGLTLDPAAKAEFKKQVIGYMSGQGQRGKDFAEFHFWRELLSRESSHLKDMTNDSFLKGYVSTTREIGMAKGSATGLNGGQGVRDTNELTSGFIYVLRVKSGFLLKPKLGGVTKEEAEVSHLGPIKWKNVYGFKQCAPGVPVYLRNDFDKEDNDAFRQVLGSMSA